jgi:probable F420-dependent oxidoreductase
VSRRTPPPSGDAVLPDYYKRAFDPFVAMATAAAATERLRVGTGICLVAQRDPIVTAKAVASLDHLSGGRFTLGLGFGWNVEEAADHGVEWRTRRELGRDRMALMRALWAEEPTGYQGEYGSVRASHAHPKPAQKPRGPVVGPRTLVGGAAGPKLFAHISEYADGWMPIGGRGLSDSIPVLRAAWADAGRDPEALQVVPSAVLPTPGKLAHYAELGIEEVVLQLPPAGEADVLRVLEEYGQYV